MARLVILLLANGSDAASRQAGGSGANELGEPADQLKLGQCAGNAELGVEQVKRLLQILKGIPGKY